MGAQAAVNAVHYHRIQQAAEGAERDALVESLRTEYKKDVSLEKLASELVVDAVVPFTELRGEISARFARAGGARVASIRRKHLVPPM
jgi:acetyl-CoA carboxylase carboxyltransferase component